MRNAYIFWVLLLFLYLSSLVGCSGEKKSIDADGDGNSMISDVDGADDIPKEDEADMADNEIVDLSPEKDTADSVEDDMAADNTTVDFRDSYVAPEVSLCSPELGPYPPSGTADLNYYSWESLSCLSNTCLCEEAAQPFLAKLLACEAVSGGYWWGLGSLYARVSGRANKKCIIDVGSEVEGGMQISRCQLPLPITPWSGLMEASTDGTSFFKGIEDKCEETGECCLLTGCPNPCSEMQTYVPLCPEGTSIPCD